MFKTNAAIDPRAISAIERTKSAPTMLRRTATLALLPLVTRALRIPTQQFATTRRAVCASAFPVAAAAAFAAASPVEAASKPVSDGKWAQHFDEFTDADFDGFTTAPSGLQYKIIEEGFGVKPLSGQKIKVR